VDWGTITHAKDAKGVKVRLGENEEQEIQQMRGAYLTKGRDLFRQRIEQGVVRIWLGAGIRGDGKRLLR